MTTQTLVLCRETGVRRVSARRPAHVLAWLAALLFAAVPLAASADDELPGRVGRIAEFAGELFLSPQDRATEWEAIDVNYPVTSGDNLWVSGDGRAEVDYGGGQFRLAGDTNLHVSRLDDRQLALFVAQGRTIVRVRVLDPEDAARVDTPNAQGRLTRPGRYGIDVSADGQTTTVTVREGEAQVALAAGVQQALPGQTLTVAGPSPVSVDVRIGIAADSFDTWSASRDRHYERGRSTAYVSRQMVGYADLDEYGTWQTSADYGAVWYPASVPADWAPYRDGRWTYVGGWGWTWVDRAPWGYAPFHYGRWTWIGGRWGWCPGAYVARPVWAPALVGWFGGASWGLSAAVGAPVYGWVPLAWGEPYYPAWRGCSRNCWVRHNRPYAVDVAVRTNAPPTRYRNVGIGGAVTAVTGATMAGRRPVLANVVPLPGSLANIGPALRRAPDVKPEPLREPARPQGLGGVPPPASHFYPSTRPGLGAAPAPSGPQAAPRLGAPRPSAPLPSLANPAPPNAVAPAPRPGSAFQAQQPPQAPRTSPQPLQPPQQAQVPQQGQAPQGAQARQQAQPPQAQPQVQGGIPLPPRPVQAPSVPNAAPQGLGGLSAVPQPANRAAAPPVPRSGPPAGLGGLSGTQQPASIPLPAARPAAAAAVGSPAPAGAAAPPPPAPKGEGNPKPGVVVRPGDELAKEKRGP